MRNKLLHPIGVILSASEALLTGLFGALTDKSREMVLVINDYARKTGQRVEQVIALVEAQDNMLSPGSLHDIFSPSSTLLTYCDFLTEGFGGSLLEEQAQQIQLIADRTHHLRRQLYNLVDYARLNNMPPDEVKVFEFQKLIKPDIIAMAHTADLHWHIPVDLPAAYGSRHCVLRVVINLLANALQAADRGTVEVHAVFQDNRIRLTVQDTGHGIPHDAQDSIFEPYYQVKPTPDQLGLGLTVSRDYAYLLGGELHIESLESEGTFATFTIATA